jgi:hypothetical protein
MIADTGKAADREIKDLIKERDAILAENSWLSRQLELSHKETPSGGAISNPTTPPLVEVKPPKDTNSVAPIKQPVLYPYDLPISMTATKDKITFLTINPYLRYYGEPYTKSYEFDRTTSDFEFALAQTQSKNLDGIVLNSRERFFSFDGITAGAGAMFPKDFYALIEFKFSMYERLHIAPRVTSRPEAGIELKYDIIK